MKLFNICELNKWSYFYCNNSVWFSTYSICKGKIFEVFVTPSTEFTTVSEGIIGSISFTALNDFIENGILEKLTDDEIMIKDIIE